MRIFKCITIVTLFVSSSLLAGVFTTKASESKTGLCDLTQYKFNYIELRSIRNYGLSNQVEFRVLLFWGDLSENDQLAIRQKYNTYSDDIHVHQKSLYIGTMYTFKINLIAAEIENVAGREPKPLGMNGTNPDIWKVTWYDDDYTRVPYIFEDYDLWSPPGYRPDFGRLWESGDLIGSDFLRRSLLYNQLGDSIFKVLDTYDLIETDPNMRSLFRNYERLSGASSK
ncbi:MAG: hypothetical protein ACSHYA_04965 [Opitutaceae bacterium]